MAGQARAERTRKALLRTAAEAFDRIGYERATLGEISRAAGVTKGALFFHFPSKAELAHAIQVSVCAQFRATLEALAQRPGPAMQNVIDITHILAGKLRDEAATRAAIRLAQECGPPAGRSATDCFQLWLNSLEKLLHRATADRSFLPQPDNRAIAALLLSIVVGTQLFSRDLCPPTTPESPGATAGGSVATADWLERTWALILPQVVPAGQLARLRTRPPATVRTGEPVKPPPVEPL
ncbi:ScbR family autoregulator-binding transcription factor [Streptomyces sp. NPDC093097]|uniref:ScbR family autoregulator-binding transcription factor n=1 Tax=Streptomyces sp. NPDC093097 TaxID=3366027 RepID=UPI0038097946